MSSQRYPEEFRVEAVKQVTEHGLPVAEVVVWLDLSVQSLSAWVKCYSKAYDRHSDAQGLHRDTKHLLEHFYCAYCGPL